MNLIHLSVNFHSELVTTKSTMLTISTPTWGGGGSIIFIIKFKPLENMPEMCSNYYGKTKTVKNKHVVSVQSSL